MFQTVEVHIICSISYRIETLSYCIGRSTSVRMCLKRLTQHHHFGVSDRFTRRLPSVLTVQRCITARSKHRSAARQEQSHFHLVSHKL